MNICIIHKGNTNTSAVRSYLQENNDCCVHEISLYEGTLSALYSRPFDIIIFDCITWKGEYTDLFLIKEIRKMVPVVPILLATSSAETASYRETMLDGGVDGCVQTPFLQEELFLRIKKLLSKKSDLLFTGTIVETDEIRMDIRNHIVEHDGEKIELTKTEYSILLHLFLHKNILVSTKELSLCLKEAGENSLALGIHIFNLRKKINRPSLIKTIPLYGFTVSDSRVAA